MTNLGFARLVLALGFAAGASAYGIGLLLRGLIRRTPD